MILSKSRSDWVFVIFFIACVFITLLITFYVSGRIDNQIRFSTETILLLPMGMILSLIYFLVCLRSLIRGLQVAIFLLPFQWFGVDVGFSVSPLDIVLLVLWVSTLFKLAIIKKNRIKIKYIKFFLPVALYLIFVFISTLAHYGNANVDTLLRHLVAVSLVILYPLIIQEKHQLKRVMDSFYIMGVIVVITSLVLYIIDSDNINRVVPGSPIRSVDIPYLNLLGNLLGFYLVFATLFSYNRLVAKGGVLSIIIFPLCLLALLLTFSRGAWLGFFSGLMILYLRRGNLRNKKVILGLLVTVFILLTAGSLIAGRLIATADTSNRAWLSLEERFYSWSNVANLIQANPIVGVGYGNIVQFNVVPNINDPNTTRTIPVHNAYLDVAGQLGLPTLICLLWFFGRVCQSLWRLTLMQRKISQPIKIYGNTILSVLVGFLVFNLSGDMILAPLLFWSILGVGVVITLNAQRPAQAGKMDSQKITLVSGV